MFEMCCTTSLGRRQNTQQLSRSAICFLTRLRRNQILRKNCSVATPELVHTGGVTRKSGRKLFLRTFKSGRKSPELGVGRALTIMVPRLDEEELLSAIGVVKARKLPGKNLREILEKLGTSLSSDVNVLARACRTIVDCENVKDLRVAQICVEALGENFEEFNLPTIIAFCKLARFQPKVLWASDKIGVNIETIMRMCESARKNPEADLGVFRDIMIAVGRLGLQPSEEIQHFLSVKVSDGISEIRKVRELLLIADCANKQTHVDYCLLHDVARQASNLMEKMEISDLNFLMGIFARQEIYDGEFLDRARERLVELLGNCEKEGMTVAQTMALMTVISRLNTCLDPDEVLLELLCMRARELMGSFSESNIAHMLLALQKRRPVRIEGAVGELLKSVEEKEISTWTACGAATVFCALSKLSHFSEELAGKCLTVVNKKGMGRLGGAQSQQLLAVLSHHVGEIPKGLMKTVSILGCAW